jgi:hypothetical protein
MKHRDAILAGVLYGALTFVLAWPLSAHPAASVLWMGADTPLFAWTLAWDVHALTHHPWSIFDANIFYPNRLTLAYSENLIGSAPFAAPALWLADNPILAVNLVALTSCVLCGVGAFVLARRLGIGVAGSFLAGMVFAFSPPRFGRIGQLHLTAVQWIPFALAALHKYLDEGLPRDLKLAAGLFTLQALASGHGAVFLTIAAAGLVAWRVALGEPVALSRRARDLGVAGVLLLLPVALLFLPYRAVQHEVGLRRPLDARWWTDWFPAAISFVASPAHVPRWIASWFVDLKVFDEASAFLFPGLLPLGLGAIALARGRSADGRDRAGASRAARSRSAVAAWMVVVFLVAAAIAALAAAGYVALVGRIAIPARTGDGYLLRIRSAWRPTFSALVLLAAAGEIARQRWRAGGGTIARTALAWHRWRAGHRADAALFYAALMVVSVWISMGAPLGPWTLVYRLPGFNFIRVPSRFTILALVSLSVLAGFGFERIAARLNAPRRAVLALAIGLLMAAEFAMAPLPTTPYRAEIPAVDRWLDAQSKPFVVGEVPFSEERDQATYMLHSTAHWQKTVAGYSGIRPPFHEEANRRIRQFPAEVSLATMASMGVTYVVVHGDRYRPEQWLAVQEGIEKAGRWLTLVHEEGAGRVYALHRPGS